MNSDAYFIHLFTSVAVLLLYSVLLLKQQIWTVFSMCYLVKLKAFLMQHCCETLCAREMMQEVRIVVCDYHDSKSVKVFKYFLNMYQECQRGNSVATT